MPRISCSSKYWESVCVCLVYVVVRFIFAYILFIILDWFCHPQNKGRVTSCLVLRTSQNVHLFLVLPIFLVSGLYSPSSPFAQSHIQTEWNILTRKNDKLFSFFNVLPYFFLLAYVCVFKQIQREVQSVSKIDLKVTNDRLFSYLLPLADCSVYWSLLLDEEGWNEMNNLKPILKFPSFLSVLFPRV